MAPLPPKNRTPRIRVLFGGHAIILTTILVGVLAAHAGAGQLHAFAALLLAFQAVAGVRSWHGLRRVRVFVDAPTLGAVDATPAVRVRIENAKRFLAASSLEVDVTVAPGGPFEVAPLWIDRVAARSSIEAELPVRAARRGVGRLVELRLSSAYPAHLFRRTLRFALETELAVAPASVDVEEPTGVAAASADRRRRELETGDDFRGVRPWREGESPRTIHPRTSARRGIPIARENESTGRPPITLVVDPRGAAPAAVEVALAKAATLVRRAARERRRCSMRLSGRAEPVEVRDARTCAAALDAIARYVDTKDPPPVAPTVGIVVRLGAASARAGTSVGATPVVGSGT